MSTHIVQLGTTTFRNREFKVELKSEDRLRHMYTIGKTGTGKSTLYQNMALQDIEAGEGVCFIDPHGEAIDWLLARIPAERLEDVVIFDPADSEWAVGLNLLEWKTEAEKDFLVAEVIQIFYKLFDPEQQGIVGPQFEHWLRNAALTVMADPAGGTLLEIPRLFTDSEFEAEKRRHVTDKVVLAFWEQQMAQTAHFHRSEMLNYFTSKFGRFMTNTLMRNIMGQKQSTISLPDIIEQRKILLVNLSKGKLGELNSYMLGLILMTKLAAAIMQRAELEPTKRHPFYLFVDEFQNVMTDTFASLLSEARKYGLAVHLAHQYMPQLLDTIRDAILGNVATLVSFQVGSPDVEALLPEFEAHTSRKASERLQADDFQYLPKHTFFIRMIIDGVTYPAFRAQSLPPFDRPAHPAGGLRVNPTIEQIQAVSKLRYTTPQSMLNV